MLIRPVLKSRRENDAEIVENKTEVNWTETENECDDSSDIVAMTIWISDNSNFFSKKMMRELCVDLFQSLFAESAVLFFVNFTVLTASSFFNLSALNAKFAACSISSTACQNSSAIFWAYSVPDTTHCFSELSYTLIIAVNLSGDIKCISDM